MESQKSANHFNNDNFAVGKHRQNNYNRNSFKYFLSRVANKTGYRKEDVETVLKCLIEILEECLVDVYENPLNIYTFGPFDIYAKKFTRTGTWRNPNTGEIVKLYPHIIPSFRLRSFWKDTFSMTRGQLRKELGLDINGESVN